VGWAILLDYLFLPLVIWLIGGSYLQGQFPNVPFFVWIVVYVVITSALNVIGLKVADRANFVLMTVQLLILALFVILSITHLVGDSQSLVSTTPFTGGGGFSALAAGAAVAASLGVVRLLGAIVLVALIGGGITIVVTYFVTLVSPGGTFANSSSLASDIAKTVGGSLFGAVFLTGLIVGQFASGLAAQAAVARPLYAMGRDRVLPQRAFGWESERFHTPVFNIALCGVIGLAAIFLDVATSTSFINFGAFTAFTFVNVAVIAYFLRHRGEHLSPWRYVLLPAVGAAIDIYLLTELDSKALILGLSWLGIGIVYLVVLTRRLTKEPPEMTAIAEAE
jgi:amino acid transporter